MIVAGGWDGSVLDSTEIYSFSDDSWTVAGKLPAKMDSMIAATIDNRVLLLGNSVTHFIVINHLCIISL